MIRFAPTVTGEVKAIKVGDELAATSIVRGVDNPCRKESYYSNRLGYVDYVTLTISSLIGSIVIFY